MFCRSIAIVAGSETELRVTSISEEMLIITAVAEDISKHICFQSHTMRWWIYTTRWNWWSHVVTFIIERKFTISAWVSILFHVLDALGCETLFVDWEHQPLSFITPMLSVCLDAGKISCVDQHWLFSIDALVKSLDNMRCTLFHLHLNIRDRDTQTEHSFLFCYEENMEKIQDFHHCQ